MLFCPSFFIILKHDFWKHHIHSFHDVTKQDYRNEQEQALTTLNNELKEHESREKILRETDEEKLIGENIKAQHKKRQDAIQALLKHTRSRIGEAQTQLRETKTQLEIAETERKRPIEEHVALLKVFLKHKNENKTTHADKKEMCFFTLLDVTNVNWVKIRIFWCLFFFDSSQEWSTQKGWRKGYISSLWKLSSGMLI